MSLGSFLKSLFAAPAEVVQPRSRMVIDDVLDRHPNAHNALYRYVKETLHGGDSWQRKSAYDDCLGWGITEQELMAVGDVTDLHPNLAQEWVRGMEAW